MVVAYKLSTNWQDDEGKERACTTHQTVHRVRQNTIPNLPMVQCTSFSMKVTFYRNVSWCFYKTLIKYLCRFFFVFRFLFKFFRNEMKLIHWDKWLSWLYFTCVFRFVSPFHINVNIYICIQRFGLISLVWSKTIRQTGDMQSIVVIVFDVWMMLVSPYVYFDNFFFIWECVCVFFLFILCLHHHIPINDSLLM